LNTGYTGGSAVSFANVLLEIDGQIVVLTNSVELGQGIKTVCAQLASESLSVPIQQVRISGGDSSVAPYCDGTGASQSTYLVGNSVIKACLDLKAKILEQSALILGLNKAKLTIQNGHIYEMSNNSARLSLENLAKQLLHNKGLVLSAMGSYKLSTRSLDAETGQGVPYEAFSYAAAGVQLAVDRRTGKVKLDKVYCAFDVGKAISPLLIRGQINGGLSMDMGYALSENLYPNYPKSLSPNVQSFHDYPMMTSVDMPEVSFDIVEEPAPRGPGGAKGVGEIAATVYSAAIANAIYDAIGIRIRSLPITPEVVLRALQNKQESILTSSEIYAAIRRMVD
jgi:CO/xanthine dehydrogenase Mo-binding subunit